MGSAALWDRLKAIGFKPDLIYSISNGIGISGTDLKPKIRLDIQSIFYGKLRSIYGYHNAAHRDAGHQKVEMLLMTLVNSSGIERSDLIIYFDGEECLEKQNTHRIRHHEQQQELVEADNKVNDIIERFNNNNAISKSMFTVAHRHLSNSFRLPLEIRQECSRYLRDQGWDARVAPFEADVQIAKDVLPQDLVIANDGDFFGYRTVNTIVKPISNDRFLLYDVNKVAEAMEISRAGLTAFMVVNKNDYDDNIRQIGPTISLRLIQKIESSRESQMEDIAIPASQGVREEGSIQVDQADQMDQGDVHEIEDGKLLF